MKPSNPTGGTEEDAQLSACHKAPVVICEGVTWDVPLGSIREGSTYFYGCTECHKACNLYVAPAKEDAIDRLISNLTNAKQAAVNAVDDSDEYFETSDMVKPANDLLDKFKAEAKQQIQGWIAEARKAGMEQAKSRVLRRTEIPKDARNPTRDAIVILGEQIADIIDEDIADLAALGGKSDQGKSSNISDSEQPMPDYADNLVISFEDYGPAVGHNLMCWICEERKAVYHMHPTWCFGPCWECDAEIGGRLERTHRLSTWLRQIQKRVRVRRIRPNRAQGKE